MLIADALRGEDSTGMICVGDDGEFSIIKDKGNPYDFYYAGAFNNPAFNDTIKNGQALIGHNRKATVGKVTAETAHPFVVDGKYAMVHNGTLTNHKELGNTDVDSEALAQVLYAAHKEGGQEALETALGKVRGAYATVSYNQDDNCIRIIRNAERPMCLAETPTAWYFASESTMLLWILYRNRIAASDITIHEVKAEHEYVIDLDKKDAPLTETALTVKKATPPHTPPTGRGRVMDIGGKKTHTEKKDLKAFRREWLGKRCPFYVSRISKGKDVAPNSDVMYLIGESDFTINHIISFKGVEGDFFDMSDSDILETIWEGRISRIEHMIFPNHSYYRISVEAIREYQNTVTH